MPIRGDILSELAGALAELYPHEGSIRALVTTAGLTLGQIPFYPRPIDTWVFVLQEAEAQGRTQVLLDQAKGQYPVEEHLRAASHAYTDWVTAGRPDALPTVVLRKPKYPRYIFVATVVFALFVGLLLVSLLYQALVPDDGTNDAQKPITVHGTIISSTYEFVDMNDDPHTEPSYETDSNHGGSRYYPAASGIELQVENGSSQKHILLKKRLMIRLVDYQPTKLEAVRVILPSGADGYLLNFGATVKPESIGQIVEAEPIDQEKDYYDLDPGGFEVFAAYIDYTEPGTYTFEAGVEYTANGIERQEWAEAPFTIEVPGKYHVWNPHASEWSTTDIGGDGGEPSVQPEATPSTLNPVPPNTPTPTPTVKPISTDTSTPTPGWSTIHSFPAPGAGPAGLVQVKDTIWVSVPSEGRLYWGDLKGSFENNWFVLPRNGCDPLNFDSCQGGLAWDGTSLWFATGNSVYQIDPKNGQITEPFEVDLAAIVGITWDEQGLLMIDAQGNLVRYDRSGTKLRKLAIGAPEGRYTGMAWVEGELWVVDIFGHLYRFGGEFEQLDPFDKFDLSKCANAEFPFYLALSWDGNNLWTADFTDAQISACGPAE